MITVSAWTKRCRRARSDTSFACSVAGGVRRVSAVIVEGDISASLFYTGMLLSAAAREPITTSHIRLRWSFASSQKR